MPSTTPAARALGDDLGGRVVAPVLRRRRHALRGGDRRARRRVDLLVVVQLDDLGALEERRRQLGEAHHQHRADRRSSGRSPRSRSTVANSSRELGELGSLKPVVPTTACTPCSAHQREVLARRVEHREVDRDLDARVARAACGFADLADACRARRADPVDPGVQRIDRGDELHVGRRRCTARHTVEPMRPPAPNTPTRIIRAGVPACVRPGRHGRAASRRSSRLVVVRADDGERARRCRKHAVDDARRRRRP